MDIMPHPHNDKIILARSEYPTVLQHCFGKGLALKKPSGRFYHVAMRREDLGKYILNIMDR